MIKLRCVVEHITYQNSENGYSIMRVNVKGYSDLVTIVGSLLECLWEVCYYVTEIGR